MIVLKDNNVKEIIQNALKKKASSYKFLLRNSLIQEANNIYHEWKSLTEIAEVVGIKFNSIVDTNELKNKKNNRSLTKDQLEKCVILIYFHFTRYRLLHIKEFEKMVINIIENE